MGPGAALRHELILSQVAVYPACCAEGKATWSRTWANRGGMITTSLGGIGLEGDIPDDSVSWVQLYGTDEDVPRKN